MASKKMIQAINKQINAETYSAYLYFSMSAVANCMGLKGAANWLFTQGQEEMTHAWRFFIYVQRVGDMPVMASIDQPPHEFKSLLHIFEEVLKHEKKVTALINGLVDLATKENDHATQGFLQWFVNEQIEEEENATDIVNTLKLAGRDGSALLMIDKDLGTRMFVMPPDLAGTGAAGA